MPPPSARPLLDSRGVYWCAMLIAGFAYVAIVLCHRSLPCESGNNPWGDWLGILLAAPTLYHLGARHTLYEFGAAPGRALLWNALGFGLPFVAALHWEWVGQLTGANFSLTARQLAHLNPTNRLALVGEIVVAGAIAAVCVREARRAGMLASYLLSFAGLLLVLTTITGALGPHYHVHVHHYFLALCLLPFVRFRQPVCFVTQAFLAGLFVEGACRWGLDPVWIAGP